MLKSIPSLVLLIALTLLLLPAVGMAEPSEIQGAEAQVQNESNTEEAVAEAERPERPGWLANSSRMSQCPGTNCMIDFFCFFQCEIQYCDGGDCSSTEFCDCVKGCIIPGTCF